MKIEKQQHKLSSNAAEFLSKTNRGPYINGKWRDPEGNGLIEVVNPATEAVIAQVSNATSAEVNGAVEAAAQAFSGPWNKLPPIKREKLLLALADKMDAEVDTLAEILTMENGKLYSHAQSEIKGAANTFRYYAGWATKLEGQTLDLSLRQPAGKQNFAFTRKEPIGVVAAIVPWNFPVSIAAWKLAPLLAAGCTAVIKPSEVTPLSTLYMADFFDEVGFPPGVVNVITGDGAAGAALTSHPKVDKITFTGSTQVGKIIGRTAMDDLKDVSLELGGKSPAIVFDDADMEAAAKFIAMGIFRNGGQVCVAGSRLYVQKKSYDKLLAALAGEAQKMKISNGFDKAADLGPLVSAEHLASVQGFIEKGVAEQAEVVCGGGSPEGQGYYLEPTIFSCTDQKSTLISEEIFGPVLAAMPFDTMEDALRMANDSRYGLSSTVWTQDISKALTCVNELNAGWVFVNSVARSDANLPLGGNKQSGLGRELGKEGVYNYMKTKSVNIVF